MLLMAKMGKGYKHINFETLASLWRVESVKVWETLTWNSWHHADIFQKFLTCSGPSIWLALTAVHSQWPGRCSDGSLKTTKPMWSCLRRLSRDSDVWAYLKDGIKWVRMLKTTPDTSQIGLKVLKHLITPRMARQLCKSLKVLDKKLPSSILRCGFAAPRSDVHRHSIGFNFSCLRIHFVFYFELFTLCFWGSPVHARPCYDHTRSKFDLTSVYPRDLHWSICKGERRTAGCIGPLGHGSNFCLKVKEYSFANWCCGKIFLKRFDIHPLCRCCAGLRSKHPVGGRLREIPGPGIIILHLTLQPWESESEATYSLILSYHTTVLDLSKDQNIFTGFCKRFRSWFQCQQFDACLPDCLSQSDMSKHGLRSFSILFMCFIVHSS